MSSIIRRNGWQWFPIGLIASMAVVFAVNGAMVAWALTTFPGAADGGGFEESNRYDQVLERVAAQRALGWQLDASMLAAHPRLQLRGPDGAPLRSAMVSGHAQRPLGPAQTTALRFDEVAPGDYVADRDLPAAGQWDLMLDVSEGGHRLAQTRRVLVP